MKSEKYDWLSVVFNETAKPLILATVRDSGFTAWGSEKTDDLITWTFTADSRKIVSLASQLLGVQSAYPIKFLMFDKNGKI